MKAPRRGRIRSMLPLEQLTGHRLRQGGWTLADQMLSSGTNFGVAIIAARALGPSDYGSFAFAYAAWITVMGIGRSLLVQPYQVSSAHLEEPEWRKATSIASGAVVYAGVIAGIVVAIIGLVVGTRDATGTTLLVAGAATPFLLLQDFWRFAAFTGRRPRSAAANDGLWAVVQVVALLLVASRPEFSPSLAYAAWASGAAAGALFGMWQFRVRPSFGRESLKVTLGLTRLGAWFTASNIIYQVGTQATFIIIGVFGSRAALGGIRSITNLFGPTQLLMSAAENIALPAAARSYSLGGTKSLRKVAAGYSIAMATVVGLYGTVLFLLGPDMLSFVFGDEFTRFMPLLVPIAVAQFVTTWASGASIGLRSTRSGRELATVQSVLVVTRVVVVFALIVPFGLVAAAWGFAVTMLVRSIVMWRQYLRVAARVAAQPAAESAP